MANTLTREEMIQKMMAVAAHQEAALTIFLARHLHPDEMAKAIATEGVSEEVYMKTGLSYAAGYSKANELWSALMAEFKEMPLYRE